MSQQTIPFNLLLCRNYLVYFLISTVFPRFCVDVLTTHRNEQTGFRSSLAYYYMSHYDSRFGSLMNAKWYISRIWVLSYLGNQLKLKGWTQLRTRENPWKNQCFQGLCDSLCCSLNYLFVKWSDNCARMLSSCDFCFLRRQLSVFYHNTGFTKPKPQPSGRTAKCRLVRSPGFLR